MTQISARRIGQGMLADVFPLHEDLLADSRRMHYALRSPEFPPPRPAYIARLLFNPSVLAVLLKQHISLMTNFSFYSRCGLKTMLVVQTTRACVQHVVS